MLFFFNLRSIRCLSLKQILVCYIVPTCLFSFSSIDWPSCYTNVVFCNLPQNTMSVTTAVVIILRNLLL